MLNRHLARLPTRIGESRKQTVLSAGQEPHREHDEREHDRQGDQDDLYRRTHESLFHAPHFDTGAIAQTLKP